MAAGTTQVLEHVLTLGAKRIPVTAFLSIRGEFFALPLYISIFLWIGAYA